MTGIYIHWPFCIKKCPYCDFNSHVVRTIDQKVWLKHYLKDLNDYEDDYKDKKIETLFFGGGTPSLMSANTVEKIIDKLNLSSDVEITLEVNPSFVESKHLQDFKIAGVNRLSIGVQSFRDENLKFLQRVHSAQEAISVIEKTSNIFNNFSFDLIYGLHNDNLAKWKEDLDFALSFMPNHISLYQLSIEENTKFKKLYDLGRLKVLDDDTSVDLYQYTEQFLRSKNILQYEVSNYAKKGFESKHNLKYWNYEEYLGYGPGAHSRIHTEKGVYSRTMESLPINWLRNRGEVKTLLSEEEAFKEAMIMSLRLTKGITRLLVEKFNQNWSVFIVNAKKAGLVVENDSVFVPNFIYLNIYLVELINLYN